MIGQLKPIQRSGLVLQFALMSGNLLHSEPKTRKGRQVIDDREPKIIENVKKAMFIKTSKTSQHMSNVMTDLVRLLDIISIHTLIQLVCFEKARRDLVQEEGGQPV